LNISPYVLRSVPFERCYPKTRKGMHTHSKAAQLFHLGLSSIRRFLGFLYDFSSSSGVNSGPSPAIVSLSILTVNLKDTPYSL
jgi:hypothetical protein